MNPSLHNLRESLLPRLLDFLWQQWSALGVAQRLEEISARFMLGTLQQDARRGNHPIPFRKQHHADQADSGDTRLLCKAPQWKRQWERAMRDLAASGAIEVDRQLGVYRGTRRYRFGTVEVRPVADFPRKLCAGGIF
jgi:hypothetical protein